jgi:hypothetical protein
MFTKVKWKLYPNQIPEPSRGSNVILYTPNVPLDKLNNNFIHTTMYDSETAKDEHSYWQSTAPIYWIYRDELLDLSTSPQIEINNINNSPQEIIDEMYQIVEEKAGNFNIYIEVWKEEEARKYFTWGNKILDQPIGPSKLVEGGHDFDTKSKIAHHALVIFYNENWKATLLHELFHVISSEFIGEETWNKLGEYYKDIRKIDPFEATAIIAADPKIILNTPKLDE